MSLLKPQKKADVITLAYKGPKPSPAHPPTCVGDVMTTTVISLAPEHRFTDAIGLMANRPFRHFLVVDDNLHLVGVISDRDLLRALARTRDWQAETVSQVMTIAPVTVRPETPLSEAVEKMLFNRINCLPVVEETGTVCGIITSTDLLTVLQKWQSSLERVTRPTSAAV